MNTQFMRHAAQVVEEGVMTGHDWPNTQDELNRLNAARRLRDGADALDRMTGERAVLVRLLRAADNVLDTLDPESDAESEGLAALRQAIAAAAQHQAG